MKRLSSREVDDRAAAWAARVDNESFSAEEQVDLASWLNADVRHFGAYAKARAVLAAADRAKVMGPEFHRSLIEGGRAHSYPSSFVNRRGMFALSAAACLTVAVGSIPFVMGLLTQESYATAIGETRVVSLSDGSVISLNTDTKVLVHYTKDRRNISLVKGEALFDVAKNKNRPFVVTAGSTSVRAVGTSFSVRLLSDEVVNVLVREGKVEVKHEEISVSRPSVTLVAGHTALAPKSAPIQMAAVPPAQIARVLSWRVGRLSFEDEALADAADEFSRYSEIKIEIADPELAKETVTGLFVSNDPIGFSKAVAASMGLRVQLSDNVVRISR